MERPRITIKGEEHEMITLNGRAYRIAAEFDKNKPLFGDSDFIERHAELAAEFYDGVTKEDILEMPLEEILPASMIISREVARLTWEKVSEISKNSEEGKEQ